MIRVFIDVETTGTDPKTCSIVQLAGIIKSEVGEEEFNFKVKPYKGEKIDLDAAAKTGLTDEILQTYPESTVAFNSFKRLLKKHKVNTSFKNKAFFIGYNSSFDMDFLRSFFEFHGDVALGYYFWWPDLDVAKLAALYLIGKRSLMSGFHLTDVYREIFNKSFENAHDALADIRATKEIFEYLSSKMLTPLLQNPS